MTNPDPDVPFEVVQLVDLEDWLQREFIWRKSGDEWIYAGKCRRCGHDIDKLIRSQGLYAFQQTREADPEARAMRCNCAGKHEGRDGGDGCGAWWGLGLERRDTAK